MIEKLDDKISETGKKLIEFADAQNADFILLNKHLYESANTRIRDSKYLLINFLLVTVGFILSYGYLEGQAQGNCTVFLHSTLWGTVLYDFIRSHMREKRKRIIIERIQARNENFKHIIYDTKENISKYFEKGKDLEDESKEML